MMDSNAAQFERLGHPWVSERDRREMPVSIASRRLKKAAGQLARLKPEFREERTIARALTADEERRAKHRAALAEVRRNLRDSKLLRFREPYQPLVDPKRLELSASEQAERRATARAAAEAWAAEAERKRLAHVAEYQAEQAAERAAAFADQMAPFAAAMAEAMAD